MNDSSEYSYAKAKFIKAYQNRQVWIEDVPRYMANIKLNAHEGATVMMIGCLTEMKDDIGLWDRYAQGGTGCVIGIDANWLATQAGVAARRVSYDARYLRKFVNSGLSMLQSHHEENRDDRDELAMLATMLVLDLYAFKDPRFASEKEVRISRLTIADSKAEFGLSDPGGTDNGAPLLPLPVNQIETAYGAKRFVDLPLWDRETQTAIKAIGFGPKADASNESIVKAAASRFGEIGFWRSDAPLR